MCSTNEIVYMIQPCVLKGTNRIKIGCSSKKGFDRVRKGYLKGTIWFSINEVPDCKSVERRLKKRFNKKFTRIAGCEFFEGDLQEMKKEYFNIRG